MTINVYIPTPFVKFTDGQSNIFVEKYQIMIADRKGQFTNLWVLKSAKRSSRTAY